MPSVYDWEKQNAKYSGAGQKSNKALGKVNFDLIVSTIPSIEGYYYGALFVACHTGYKWLYGLKKRDEALDTAK